MDCTITPNPILPGAGVPRSAARVQACPQGLYDGAFPNPRGRNGPDERKRCEAANPRRKILKCKHPLIISTYNARTLRARVADSSRGETVHKNYEICHLMKQNRIEICGIQETRLKHENDRREMVNSYPTAFGYTVISMGE